MKMIAINSLDADDQQTLHMDESTGIPLVAYPDDDGFGWSLDYAFPWLHAYNLYARTVIINTYTPKYEMPW